MLTPSCVKSLQQRVIRLTRQMPSTFWKNYSTRVDTFKMYGKTKKKNSKPWRFRNTRFYDTIYPKTKEIINDSL